MSEHVKGWSTPLSVRHRTQTTVKRTVPGSKSSNTGRKEKLSKAEHEDAAVARDGLRAEQKSASWLQPAKETVPPGEAWPHLTVSRFLASGTQEVLSKSPPSFSQSRPGQGHILSTLLKPSLHILSNRPPSLGGSAHPASSRCGFLGKCIFLSVGLLEFSHPKVGINSEVAAGKFFCV